MTKKKILLFLAVVMLYLTANMSGVFAWFTAYDSKELTVTSGVFVKPYLVSGEEFNEITSPVKSTVKKVEFMNTIPDLSDYKEGKTKFDVSKEQDGSVIAWVDENSTMYIGGRGGIIADQSLNTMFSYYTSVKEVIFKKVLNTKDSISARNMFLSCENLKTTDINNIDTSQIQNFQMMFANCQNIVELDISSWNVKSAKNMSGMFLNCNTLRTLNIGNNRRSQSQKSEVQAKIREIYHEHRGVDGLRSMTVIWHVRDIATALQPHKYMNAELDYFPLYVLKSGLQTCQTHKVFDNRLHQDFLQKNRIKNGVRILHICF